MMAKLARWARLTWQFARPATLALIAVHLLVIALLLDADPSAAQVLAGIVLLIAWYANATAINDLSDVEVDRRNLAAPGLDRQRPLINASADSDAVRRFAWVSGAVVAAAAAALHPWFVAIALVYLGLNLSYSLPPVRLAARGAVAQLSLPLGYVGLPYLLVQFGWSAPAPTLAAAVALVGLVLTFCGRLFLKDIRDIDGDRAEGKRTFVVRHGLHATLRPAVALASLGLVLTVAGVSLVTGRVIVILGLALIAAIAVLMFATARVRAAASREERLLWIGLFGRACGALLMASAVALLAHLEESLPAWRAEVLVLMALLVMASGSGRLRAELRRADPRLRAA